MTEAEARLELKDGEIRKVVINRIDNPLLTDCELFDIDILITLM